MRDHHPHRRFTPGRWDHRWPPDISPVIALDERGLTLGAGTRLVRMADGRMALDADGDRLLALLAVATGRAVPPAVPAASAAAAEHWRRGDKALANFRLIFAGLPQLADADDAHRLRRAAALLDDGMTPRTLLKAFDHAATDFVRGRYDPDQPRVPAGNGRASGRWGDGSGGGTNDAGWSDEADGETPTARAKPNVPAPQARIVPVVADSPFKPAGMAVVPLAGKDPLDPQGLRTRLSPQEQQDISDTVDAIIAGKPEDLRRLNPHPYKNQPSINTGAQLPQDPGGYITYYIRSPGSRGGDRGLLRSSEGLLYYTNDHYDSYYNVDLVIRTK